MSESAESLIAYCRVNTRVCPMEWTDKRLRGIAVRQDLTDEWKQRGVTNSQEFAILTMLAEATTTKLHRDRDSVGMAPLKKDAKDGGAVAGKRVKKLKGVE